MTNTCGCCSGIEAVTPIAINNRPGLSVLPYRVGTHSSFMETMLARLSGLQYPELAGLTTRNGNDHAIALLDAWAIVADVLTFYQERIANEGYLRTATERRSIMELAQLTGYTLRPGVASSVFLAYALDRDSKITLDKGNRARAIPGPNETPQSFETSYPLEARTEWNSLSPRTHRSQHIDGSNAPSIGTLYLQGTSTNLRSGAWLLLTYGNGGNPNGNSVVRRVISVTPQAVEQRTEIKLETTGDTTPGGPPQPGGAQGSVLQSIIERQRQLPTGISRRNETAQRIQALLDQLENEITADTEGPQVAAVLNSYLPDLHKIKNQISPQKAADTVREWTNQVLQALEEAASGAAAAPEPLAAKEGPVLVAMPGSRKHNGSDGEHNGHDGYDVTTLDLLLKPLGKPPSLPPANPLTLRRTLKGTITRHSDTTAQIVAAFQPALASQIYTAWENAVLTEPSPAKVYALRVAASLFGNNVPKIPTYEDGTPNGPVSGEATGAHGGASTTSGSPKLLPPDDWREWTVAADERQDSLFMDNVYSQVLPGKNSYLVVHKPDDDKLAVYTAKEVVSIPRTAYGISGKTTRITLPENWWEAKQQDFAIIRGTTVYAGSEELQLADEPIDPVNEPVRLAEIELDGLYGGLQTGRWLIVTGERTDIPLTSAVHGTELVMLSGVRQGTDPNRPGDTAHTTLLLANPLAYSYKRDTVVIYANVVKATHGETRSEVLGSGDGSKALQTFALAQAPVTYLPAPTLWGAASTLEVRVNDVLWHETDSLDDKGPSDRAYLTSTDDKGKTTVIFGNGRQGARLPTGSENVKALYRTGIGKPGNARAGQISQLATRPLGVRSVVNPLAATGGADPESRDSARRNAPLAVMSLDRLVSVRDYEDFARTYTGIGKASATRFSDGHRQIVYLTIAGAGDVPIARTSELYQNLRAALRDAGDPHQPFEIATCEHLLLVLSAKVRVRPDYKWDAVEPTIRSALLDMFSFEQRQLGQGVALSEVINLIQRVEGVDFVDVDVFGSIPGSESHPCAESLPNTQEIASQISQMVTQAEQNGPGQFIIASMARLYKGAMCPAQIAFLTPDVPDTLILTEIT